MDENMISGIYREAAALRVVARVAAKAADHALEALEPGRETVSDLALVSLAHSMAAIADLMAAEFMARRQ